MLGLQLRAVDEAFVARAPRAIRSTAELTAPPAAVFAAFTGDPAGWRDWMTGVTAGGWDTPAPHGPGSRRHVQLGPVRVEETVLVLSDGPGPSRFCFRVDRSSAPLARALVEDYTVEPAPGGGSRASWTFALEPLPLLGPAMGLTERPLHAVWARAMGRLDQQLAS